MRAPTLDLVGVGAGGEEAIEVLNALLRHLIVLLPAVVRDPVKILARNLPNIVARGECYT
jgi:hypothetical protein